jgi:deoxyribonuclease-4
LISDQGTGDGYRAAATAGLRVERLQLPGGRRFGPHLPTSFGLVRAADRAAGIGASTLQIFSDNPTAWHRRAETPPDAEAFRSRLIELDLGPIAVHASYLINLAGPDDVLFGRSVALLTQELEHASDFAARFVNVHAGSHRGAGVDRSIRRLVDGLEQVIVGAPSAGSDLQAPLIVLENSSGGGSTIGANIEELAMILDEADSRGLGDRLALCLDSAHLWGAGYDLSSPAAIDELVAGFDRLIGLPRLAMVHLNDSHTPKGSRHDRHAHLGDGQIGTEGLARLLCHPSLDHVAFYLETPGMEDGFDAVNVARLGDLAAGRPLTPAPAIGQALPDAGTQVARPKWTTSRAGSGPADA